MTQKRKTIKKEGNQKEEGIEITNKILEIQKPDRTLIW
jgi:hypothetical protein